jgi:plastocyanin
MKKLLLILSIGILLSACKKINVSSVSFDVNVSSLNYHVGDTVRFQLSGNPDYITFYPGVLGYNYDNITRTSLDGISQLQFTTTVQNGTQLNTMALLASTDFTGVYDSAHVYNSTWTDITSQAALSTGTANTASGIIDLSTFKSAGKPVFIAFRVKQAAGTTQRKWTIGSFSLNNVTPAATYLVADINSAGFLGVNILDPLTTWNIGSTIYLNTSLVNNEDWLITKPLSLTQVPPDVGIPIKNLAGNPLSSYSYTFTTPGTYKVVFVAKNQNVYDQNSIIKTFNITVN